MQRPIEAEWKYFLAGRWDGLAYLGLGGLVERARVDDGLGFAIGARDDKQVGDHRRLAFIFQLPSLRVIGADGTLTGYAGGLWRKQWLLDHERRHTGQTLL